MNCNSTVSKGYQAIFVPKISSLCSEISFYDFILSLCTGIITYKLNVSSKCEIKHKIIEKQCEVTQFGYKYSNAQLNQLNLN
jgi:hypothetical protein